MYMCVYACVNVTTCVYMYIEVGRWTLIWSVPSALLAGVLFVVVCVSLAVSQAHMDSVLHCVVTPLTFMLTLATLNNTEFSRNSKDSGTKSVWRCLPLLLRWGALAVEVVVLAVNMKSKTHVHQFRASSLQWRGDGFIQKVSAHKQIYVRMSCGRWAGFTYWEGLLMAQEVSYEKYEHCREGSAGLRLQKQRVEEGFWVIMLKNHLSFWDVVTTGNSLV